MRAEILLILALTGCQSSPPPPLRPAPPPFAPPLEWQEKALRQQQHLRALLAHNEALHERVRQLETAPAPRSPGLVPQVAAAVPPAKPAEPPAESGPVLMPNAEGMIDLLAAAALTGEEINPFAVRSFPVEAVREIALHLTGLMQGANPCALVNGRPVEPGEAVETLTLVRIEDGAALFQHGSLRLRLPVGEKPVRIKLPL